MYKQFVMALGDSKVNWIDALIRAGLKKELGIYGMMELLDHANKGLHTPKDFTEEELHHGLLFLCLGGLHIANLAHKSLGSPAKSTLKCSLAITTLSPCASTPTKSELPDNIQVIFKDTHLDANCGYVLMIDKLKIEECP